MEGRDGGVPCGEPMGEEGGLLAASETSYHKWRRGRWSTGGLCVGTGRGIECLWPCPRDADTADDEPGQSGQTQTQRFVLACMGGPAVAPAAHRLYVECSRRAARRRRSARSASIQNENLRLARPA